MESLDKNAYCVTLPLNACPNIQNTYYAVFPLNFLDYYHAHKWNSISVPLPCLYGPDSLLAVVWFGLPS